MASEAEPSRMGRGLLAQNSLVAESIIYSYFVCVLAGHNLDLSKIYYKHYNASHYFLLAIQPFLMGINDNNLNSS